MRIGARRAGICLASAGLILAATAPALAQDDWPNSGTLKDGSTFTLSQSIADKVAAGEPINYLFSYQSSSIQLFSQQYQAGYETGLEQAQAIYPVNGTIVAPAVPQQDPPQQIAQIQAQLDAGQVDCLSIEPADSNSMTDITNSTLAAGIPVFTVGLTTNGNELTNFTQVPMKEGAQAAQVVLDWMAAEGHDLKTFAVSGGDPTQFWAQGRMQGFIDTIKAAIPDANFINDASNALKTEYDAPTIYSSYQALLQGNPDLQFIENVDIGAEQAAKAIVDGGREGTAWTIGWNVSYGQLDMIDRGVQVAALDQRWAEQAGFGALACADFLKNWIVRPNTQELLVVDKSNSAAARADLDSILGTGSASAAP
jgi:ribose transport system substrate-binding protein